MSDISGNGDAARLEAVEKAITGARNLAAASATDDVVTRLNRAAEQCRAIGRYANDQGHWIDQISMAFADHLHKLMREYSTKILEAKRREMAELETMIGRLDE